MTRSVHVFPLKGIMFCNVFAKALCAMFLRVSTLWCLGWNLEMLLSSGPIAVLVLDAVEAGCYLPTRCPEATREVRGTTAYVASLWQLVQAR